MVQSLLRPLVVLTRPQGRNERLQGLLEAKGIDCLLRPALATEAAPLVCDQLPVPVANDLFVFVSGQALRFYLDALRHCEQPFDGLSEVWAATVGVASAQALRDSQLFTAQRILHPESTQAQDSEALWLRLQPLLSQFNRAIIVRAENGRDWLGHKIETAGLKLTRYAAYRRQPVRWSDADAEQFRQAVRSHRPLVVVITSTESMAAFFDNVRRLQLVPYLEGACYLLIHPRLAERLAAMPEAFSGKVDAERVLLAPPLDEAMCSTIASHFRAVRHQAGS